MKKASIRLLAYTVDFAILSVVLIGIQLALYFFANGFPFKQFSSGYQIYIWVLFTISFPTWLYFIFLECSNKQSSIGMLLFHLKVFKANNQKPKFKEIFIRTFIRLLPWEITHISLIPIYFAKHPEPNIGFWIADFIIILYIVVIYFKKGNLTVHDYFAGTCVELQK